jgi:hypothetical protein
MKNDFDTRLKAIERELIGLKTAQRFSSVRTTSISHSNLLTTGNYRVTFDNAGGDILSNFFVNDPSGERNGAVYALPPSGNSQIVQINATTTDPPDIYTPIYFSVQLTVISNYPVVSITRIS